MGIEDITDALSEANEEDDDDDTDVRKNLSKGLSNDEKFWKSYNEKKEIQKNLDDEDED